jgi:ankyrin repeat protein
VNVQDVSGKTPLTWACLKQRLESVRLLLAAGADVNIVGKFTGPLHAAAQLGNDRIVDELFASNFDEEKKKTDANIQTTFTKATALHAACSSNHLNSEKIVQMLLDSNASVTCEDYQGKSALDVATSPIIKSLLESHKNENRNSSSSGISNNTKSYDMVMQQQGQQQPDSSDSVTLGDYTEVVAEVASNVSTIKCANGNTLLHEAALHLPPGAIDTLSLQVDDATPADETALMLAYEKEMVGVFERLLANGASANTYRSRRKGATLLHIAVANSRIGTVRALVKFGHIPVDVVDNKNNTPLMYACRSGDSDRSQACIRELVDLGADINYQDTHGNTVLHRAALNEHSTEVLKLF